MSLFSVLNVSKSGMFAAQQSLSTTSHNISNINTVGYTKQRAKIQTSRAQSVAGVEGQIGTGAQVEAIERVRNNFLDYQVRNESSVFGTYDMRSSYLLQMEGVYNEPSDTGIASLMGKFFDSWQELSKQPQSSNNRTVVVQQTLALTDALNHTATRLDELGKNAQGEIRNSVNDINSMLNQLDSLNKEITTITVSGDAPNDLMDRRDLLLDDISRKFGVSAEMQDYNGLDIKSSDGMGSMPPFVNSDPNGEFTRLSYVSGIERDKTDPSGGTYKISYYQLGDTNDESNMKTLTLRDVSPEQLEKIQNSRVILSDSNGMAVKGDGAPLRDGATASASEIRMFTPENGELAGAISIQADIAEHKGQLDKMAKGLAFAVNAIHSGMEGISRENGQPEKDFMPLFVNSSVAEYTSSGEIINIDNILEAESEITAANITINTGILEDPMKLKTRSNDNEFAYASENYIDGETDGERALAIARLRDSMLKFQDIGTSIHTRADMFDLSKGGNRLVNNGMTIENNTSGMSLESYYKDGIDRLGVQSQESQRMLENQSSLVFDISMQRESVSGVSQDEETVNLVQFQHAYNANAKVISTVNELLDVVVNGLI
ncbi:flagellar hook-associated protein FlgK [uncultured Clostridium sp.]|jgi:flagellar hook-associated protein 1 FlgK|uniref:flagellar hook-associated protein FlgK n=1 Tax=uncultured Clostridium sp. TaxID=59620 RepID=UPI00262D08CF|nr:flagellar hook-associated protein FlgK [uncultured Clostridium sp.]